MSEEYIKPGRVLIAIQMIFVPLYFLILSNGFQHINLPLIPTILSEIFARLIIPLILSTPFVLFSYFQRYELSEAYEHMGERVWRLPNSIKAFYGFNFFLVVLFGLPFIAPLIAMSAGYFIGLLLFGIKEDEPQIKRPLIRGSTTLFLPLALLIAITFYFQISEFFIKLIDLWEQNIDLIYLSALNIANGALLGGLLLILFEYMEKADYTFEKPPIVETLLGVATFIILEAILLYYWLDSGGELAEEQRLIFSLVNIIGFLLSLSIVIIKWVFKIGEGDEATGLIGWITIVAFQLVNLASSGGDFAIFTRTTAVLITCGIFIILFGASYREASKYV